jgi:hypothetical protein
LVVTKDGCEVMTRFPAEELMVAGVKSSTASGPLSGIRETQSHKNLDYRGVKYEGAGMPDDPLSARVPSNGGGQHAAAAGRKSTKSRPAK